MVRKYIEVFINSVGAILILSSGAKILSSFGNAPILNQSDPIFVMSYRYFFLLSGLEKESNYSLACFVVMG